MTNGKSQTHRGTPVSRSFSSPPEEHRARDLTEIDGDIRVPATPVAGDDPDWLLPLPRAPHVCNFGGRVLYFDRAPLPWRDRTLGPVMRRPAGVDPPLVHRGTPVSRSFPRPREEQWPFDLAWVHPNVHVPAASVAGDDSDWLLPLPRAPHVCDFGGKVL